jgi:hypothetical protein
MVPNYSHLEPGGWIEMQDIMFPVSSDDNTLTKDHALRKWSDLMVEASHKTGRFMDAASLYKEQLKDAGFENIREVVYKWPMNSWPRDPKYKTLGVWSMQNMLDGVQGFTIALLTRALGWSAQEVEVLLADVRKDIVNRNVHSYWPL